MNNYLINRYLNRIEEGKVKKKEGEKLWDIPRSGANVYFTGIEMPGIKGLGQKKNPRGESRILQSPRLFSSAPRGDKKYLLLN